MFGIGRREFITLLGGARTDTHGIFEPRDLSSYGAKEHRVPNDQSARGQK
jgi:hypothetical protein